MKNISSNSRKQDTDSRKKKGFRGRHKRTESYVTMETAEAVSSEAQLVSQIDMLLELIVRSNIGREEKIRIMRSMCFIYSLDERYADDFYNNHRIEHSSDADANEETTVAFDMLLRAIDLMRDMCNNNPLTIKRVEATLVASWAIFHLRDNMDAVLLHVVQYIMSITPGPLTIGLIECLKCVLTTNNTEQSLADNFACSASTEYRDVFKTLMSKPFVTHAKTIASVLCTIGLVEPSCWHIKGFGMFTLQAFDEKRTTMVEVVDATLSATIFFFERGYMCFVQKNLRPLFVTSDRLMELEVAVEALSIKVQNHVQGSARQDFADLNTEIYQLADKLRSAAHAVKPIETPAVRRLVKHVLKLENDVIMNYKSETLRIAPYCIKTWGKSGVGKTSFNQLTMREVLRYNGFSYKDSNIRKIEPEKEYWENLNNDTTGITIDDMCNTIHTKEKVNPADILIKLVNNYPQSVNRADIADKGMIWLNPMVVGITTNNRTLAAENWSVEPMSVVRRCHLHIDLKVKTQYANSNGQLDQEAAEAAPKIGYIQDLWDISVFRVLRKNNSNLANNAEDYELHFHHDEHGEMKNVGIERYLRFLYSETKKHFANQRSFIETQKLENNTFPCCAKCHLWEGWCDCCDDLDDDVHEQDVGEEQAGIASFLFDTYFMTAMPFANASILGLLYTWVLGPHGYDMCARIMAFLCSVLIPNVWESYILRKMGQRQANVWVKQSIGLINNFVDFNMTILPSFMTNTQYATAFYMYWHRRDVYRAYSGACINAYFVVCCGIILRGLLVDRFVIHTYVWCIACFLCFIQFVYMLYDWIFQKYSTIRYHLALAQGLLTLCIASAYLVTESAAITPAILCIYGVCSFIFVLSQVYATYMRVFNRLQDLRHLGTRTKFNQWRYDMFCGSSFDFFHVTRLVHNVAVIAILINTIRLVRLGIHLYTTSVAKKMDDHGGVLSPGTVEEAERREVKPNIWAHSIQSTSKGTSTTQEFLNRCKKNLLYVKFVSATVEGVDHDIATFCDGIMLTGNVLLMPLHMVYQRVDNEWKQRYSSVKAVFVRSTSLNTGWSETIDISRGRRVEGYDLIVLPVYGGGPFKNIIGDVSVKPTYCGVVKILHRDASGDVNVRSGSVVKQEMMTYARGDIAMNWHGVHTRMSAEWMRGDCMALIISDDADPKIIGFHLIGTAELNIGISASIPHSQLNSVVMQLPGEYITHSAEDISPKVYDVPIGLKEEIHHKSPVNFVENRNFTVIGSVDGGRTPKTKVRNSIALPFLETVLGPQKYGPPRYKGFAGNQSWLPWYTNLNGTSQVSTSVPIRDLDMAVSDFKRGLVDIIQMHRNKITPLSEEVNVNGVANSRFMTGLNRDTSMGFPLGKQKVKYMEVSRVEPDGRKIYQFTDSRVWQRWYDMEEDLANGKLPTSIFKATLKDEPTKLTKEKVRVFQAADIGMQLGVRKYFLPIIRAMCLHPLLSECAVGINPFSLEWEALHGHVCKFGDERIIAGDYAGWDTTLPAILVYHSVLVLVDFAASTGNYTQRDLRVMRGLGAMLCHPLINFNGTLIRLHGTTPSGHNLTSVLNSISNSLLLRCAFYEHVKYKPLDFRSHVSNITYGDDFVAGVSSSTDFSLCVYERYLRTYTGIRVTMPDKTSAIVPYMKFSEVDFLKRKSTYIEELGAHIGVLDVNSVHKSLYTTMSSPGDEKNVLVAVVHSAMHELFYHGRDVYNYYIGIFKSMFEYLDMDPGAIYKTFDERVTDWKETYALNGIVLDDGHVDDTLAIPFEGIAPDTT